MEVLNKTRNVKKDAIDKTNDFKEEDINLKNELENKDKKKSIKINTLFYIFLIGAITGWFYELFFYGFTEGIFRNNGFFYGPYLPVYGFGAVLMSVLLKKVKDKPIIFFILAMVVTGVLEYITGFLLWQIWQIHLWDYTGLFMNISGYVCLRSVISFGIGGLMLIYFIEPAIAFFEKKISKKTNDIICLVTLGLILIDVIICLIYRHPIFKI